ncbi:MAG: hypothetical protein CL910_05225 [Deltaproteobacteria bacterium]|nr:hypothetical protein [Deltaproteobacteria bacterium]
MRRRSLWIAAATVALIATSTLAGPLGCGHHRRGHHGPFGEGGEVDKDHLRHGARWVLRSADPSDEQVDRIVEIAAAALTDLWGLHGEREARHEAVTAAFSGERVDRQALETQREEMLARADEASRRLADALADIGDVLTTEQRAELLEKHARHRGRHRWH